MPEPTFRVPKTGKKTPVFETATFLAENGVGRKVFAYRKDAVVFAQGEPADSIFYLQEGKIKLTVVSNEGKEAVIAVLNAGDFFGEGCLALQTLRMATAVAMAPSSVMRLERSMVVELLWKEPVFSELLLSYMLTRTIRIEEDLIDQLFNSSEKRLARALLLLANFGKEGKPETVIAKINQETLRRNPTWWLF